MNPATHRKTRVIRETFFYAMGVGSVAAIALLREVNLLVFITGLLLVPLIINSILARQSLWKIAARRRLPEGICAGESCVVEIEIDHPARAGATWKVMLKDEIRLVEPQSLAGLDSPTTISLLAGAGRKHVTKAAYRIKLSRRGRYQFGPLKASTRYPLGFVESAVQWSAKTDWCVLPRLGVLLPEWRYEVEAHRQGEQRSHSRRGFVEGEFHGLRQWRDGDSRRWIHWRTSARSGQLMVRQFERQQNQDLILMMDLWSPQKSTLDDAAAVELAVSFSATVIDDLCRQGAHRLCVHVHAKKSFTWMGLTSQVALAELLEALALVESIDDTIEPEVPTEFRPQLMGGVPVLRVTTRREETSTGDAAMRPTAPDTQGMLGEQAFRINVRQGDLARYFGDLDES